MKRFGITVMVFMVILVLALALYACHQTYFT